MMIVVPKKPGLYSIKNMKTGKIYIGSTINLMTRLNAHKWGLEAGRSGNRVLQKDFERLGVSSFLFDVIIVFEGSELDLSLLEQQYIKNAHNSEFGCYNRKFSLYRQGTVKRLCSLCDRTHYAKGYCNLHWARFRYQNKKLNTPSNKANP